MSKKNRKNQNKKQIKANLSVSRMELEVESYYDAIAADILAVIELERINPRLAEYFFGYKAGLEALRDEVLRRLEHSYFSALSMLKNVDLEHGDRICAWHAELVSVLGINLFQYPQRANVE